MSDLTEKLKEKIKKAKYVAAHAPELNMDNYSTDEVERLNDAMTEIHEILFGKDVKGDI